MALREVDAIDEASIRQAMIDTDKEIFGDAFSKDEIVIDESGDRTLEQMGEGLEGQHELEEDEDGEGDELSADEESEGEDDKTGQVNGKQVTKEADPNAQQQRETEKQPEGRVPPGRLREANEARRQAESELAAFKAQNEANEAKYKADLAATNARLDALTQLLQRQQQPIQPAAKTEPPPVPDMFEDPEGYQAHLQNSFKAELSQVTRQLQEQRVEMSMQMAHTRHGENFAKAYQALVSLDQNNPESRQLVSSIYSAPNPGEAVVQWHRRSEVMRQVGDKGLEGFRAEIEENARKALMSDPEFRKQLVEELRADAMTGDQGRPRTETRLPKSLNRVPGNSDRGNDAANYDNSDSAVFNSVFPRTG